MRERRDWFDLHDDTAVSPDVAILGLPFDGSASLRPGAAHAPAKLRAVSRTSDAITRRGSRIKDLSVRDYGDVAAIDVRGAPLAQRRFLDEAAARLLALPRDSFVIGLGGDNSVSIPCLRRFAAVHGAGVGVVWFDAHPDLFAAYDGNPDSHACALRRSLALAGLRPDRAVLLGTRSFSDEELGYAGEEGIEVITAAQWWASSPGDVASRIAGRLSEAPAVYLAVDIDGFDASCAPGTGYPMPGGPASEMFFALHELLFERLPIRAMDLTEIAPPLDTNDATAFLGAQVVLETLGALSRGV